MQKFRQTSIIFLLIISLSLLLPVVMPASGPATWYLGMKIWAGETVAINSTLKSPGTYTGNQSYTSINFTFTTPPIALLGLEGYNQSAGNGSLSMGFTVSITNVTNTQFTYSCTIYGANIYFLYYKYLVLDVSLTFFSVSYVVRQFTTQNITNPALTPRVTSFVMNNNAGETYNLSNSIVMIGTLAGFKFQTGTTGTVIGIQIQPLNSTSHTVTITTSGTTIITEVTYYRLAFDKTIVMDGFTNYIIMFDLQGINSTQIYYNYTFPFYNYRTQLNSWYQINIPPNQQTQFIYDLTATGFINQTNMTYNQLTCLNFIFSNMKCSNASIPYYYDPTYMCYDVCPTGYIANTTKNYCQQCYYTCQSCSSVSSSACTSCNASYSRTLPTNQSVGTCSCSNGTYDTGVVNCSTCISRCYTCSVVSTNCTSCTGNRTLNNNSCICINGFYDDNSTIGNCLPCMMGCIICAYSGGGNNTCTTCNTTLNWILSNGTCICNSTYYYNTTTLTCQPCSIGCITCTGDALCSACSNTSNRVLAGSKCNCLSNYVSINNSITCTQCSSPCASCFGNANNCTSCQYSILSLINNTCLCPDGSPGDGNGSCLAVCGDGIIQTGEQCDDGNAINGDGCSSTCQVQQNHICLSHIINVSLCYFNKQINFVISNIYKDPFDNVVELDFIVESLNCNKQKLQQFLQNSINRRMLTNRLLQNSRISLTVQPTTIQSLSYDPASNYLTIQARYYADVDFNGALISFPPSNSSVNNTVSYFYLTPDSITILSAPYNNIATTFTSKQQFNIALVVYYLYLAFIIIFLVMLLIALVLKKVPIAIECLYVINVAYYGLAAVNNLSPVYAGLGYWGKYLNGYNKNIFSTLQNCQYSLAINFQCSVIDNINITFWIGLTFLLIYLGITLVWYIRNKRFTDQQRQFEAKSLDSNHLSCINLVLLWSLQITMTIAFVICQGYAVALSFQNDNLNYMSSAIQSAIIAVFLFIILVNWFYLKFKQDSLITPRLSFYKILSYTQKWNEIPLYYYPFIMICFILNGIMLAKIRGVAAFAVIMTLSILTILLHCKFDIYHMKINKNRSILNHLAVIVICLIFIINNATNSISELPSAIIVLITLFIFLLINISCVCWMHFYLQKIVKQYQQSQNTISNKSDEPSNVKPLMNLTINVENSYTEQSTWKQKLKERSLQLKEIKKTMSIQINGYKDQSPNTRAQQIIDFIEQQYQNPEQIQQLNEL